MEYLEFDNPTFHPGLNLTVRKGWKWSKKIAPGDSVGLWKTKDLCPVRGGSPVPVIAVWKGSFFDIPCYWLNFSHDPQCRRYNGLMEKMKTFYKDFDFADDCTAILFWYNL